eukprot:scaffold70187_cov60-Phaeocystis_antarctica.AAC.3
MSARCRERPILNGHAVELRLHKLIELGAAPGCWKGGGLERLEAGLEAGPRWPARSSEVQAPLRSAQGRQRPPRPHEKRQGGAAVAARGRDGHFGRAARAVQRESCPGAAAGCRP